jgi:hypothetical protein
MNITINIRTLKVSDHARRDRWDRITNCVQTVGIGDVMAIVDSPKRKYTDERVVQVLTSTGMLFVVNLDRNSLITAYLCPMRLACAIYGTHGYSRIPNELYRTIDRNQRYYSHLYSSYI